jgi:predicted MFS family arabinose efflux permease
LGLVTYLGAFLGTTVGLSPQQVGLVYALVGGSYAIGSTVAMGRLGRIPARTMVSVSTLVSGLLVGPMLMVPKPALVLPLLLGASLAAAVCRAGVVSLLAAESPAGAGTTMLLNGSVINFGSAGGAIMGGALIALGGYGALGIGLPICAAAAAVLAWWPARSSVSL